MARLDAAANALTVLPEALCGVASLVALNLGNNDIGSLPHGLLHLTRLQKMWQLKIYNNPRLAAYNKIMGGSEYSEGGEPALLLS